MNYGWKDNIPIDRSRTAVVRVSKRKFDYAFLIYEDMTGVFYDEYLGTYYYYTEFKFTEDKLLYFDGSQNNPWRAMQDWQFQEAKRQLAGLELEKAIEES